MSCTLSNDTSLRQHGAPRMVAVAFTLCSLVSACDGTGSRAVGASSSDATVAVETPVSAAGDASFGHDVAAATQLRSASRAPQAEIARGGSVAAAPPAAPRTTTSSVGTSPLPGTMLVHTARASVEVAALDAAVAAARSTAHRLGAAVTSSTVRAGRNEVHQATLTFRVPAARYDTLLAALHAIGRMESVDAAAQDVGEEYVDVEARLANARRLEVRFLDLLARRTGGLGEVLRVESELARVRGEIDRTEGRKRYLEQAVAMSSIDLVLHEPEPLSGAAPGHNPVAAAFVRAWQLLVATVAFSITALGVLVPVALLAVVALAVARWRAARRRWAAGGG